MFESFMVIVRVPQQLMRINTLNGSDMKLQSNEEFVFTKSTI